METSIIPWIYPRLRAHLSEISAISGLLSYLLIAECRAIIHKRKWLGTTVTHFWRLTRLCRRPSAGSDGTSHLRVETLARAKTRARISAAVQSISRNDDVRVRAFTNSSSKIYHAKSHSRFTPCSTDRTPSVRYPRIVSSTHTLKHLFDIVVYSI